MKAFTRKLFLLIIDIIIVNFAILLALYFRFDGIIEHRFMIAYLKTAISLTVIKISIYMIMGLYNSLWSYAGIDELIQIFYATCLDSIFSFGFGIISGNRLPRTVYFMGWILTFLFLSGFRFSYRILRRIRNKSFKTVKGGNRILIIGAGEAGSLLIKELKKNEEPDFFIVGVIDDNSRKHNATINGIPVLGDRSIIIDTVKRERIDEIIFAIPSASKNDMREIFQVCKETDCKLRTLPNLYQIVDGTININQIRDVQIEDLLGRDQISLEMQGISGFLRDQIVLITGGGGSIGSELCRQVSKFSPKKILILDIYENNAYELYNEIKYTYESDVELEVIIASIRDKHKIEEVFEKYRPTVIFHAAAHKHVPLMEQSPGEAIKNNVIGTLNVAQAADKYKAKKFVLISTDKAVNPTNVMGASKRLAEMIVQSIQKISKTEYAVVRFGNVLGSNGSVIPLFKKQIAHGGPVTVTDPDVTRYFMTIPEAVQLVIQAGSMAKGGEIFILDMGEPVRIYDLACDLIRLSGFEPEVDIKIEYIGLRPGEKLFEELLMDEEGIESTLHPQIFIGKAFDIDYYKLLEDIDKLKGNLNSPDRLISQLMLIVPTFSNDNIDAAATKDSRTH